MDLQDKKVTVMGLGLHGGAVGSIIWLVKQGAFVTATDMKPTEELQPSVDALREQLGEDFDRVSFVLGEHRVEDFQNADVVLKNPAVRWDNEFVVAAQNAGVDIRMDSDLFFENFSGEIIGITGSKGKTTTANAIATVLREKWPELVSVGVDGKSPLGLLAEAQAAWEQNKAPVVFELSSWRLEGTNHHKQSPHVGVITSIYKEHLNTYESYEAYQAIKKSLLAHQSKNDIAILNADDEIISEWGNVSAGRTIWYSFSDSPWPLDRLPLETEHEQRNLLPAILIAREYEMSDEEIAAGLNKISRLPHRLELVRELDGVQYVNDSAATMPDACIMALRSFSDRKLVWIIGGSDKDLEFENLATALRSADVKALVWLPGTATERMQKTINFTGGAYEASSMREAVLKAREIAQVGDVVLLSPGATSFGLFKHEFHRGDRFREAVLGL